MRKLIKKDIRWRWGETEQEAFERVKQLFVESVLLQKPDYSRAFIIYSDASYKGLGSILTQQDDDGNMRVISTASRSLTPQENKLFPTEIEICAVYHALQKFRDFVYNSEIIIRTDSISLSFMQNCKLTSSRISRFIHEIMAYNIKVEYVKGTTNIFADLLSRLPRNNELSQTVDSRERKECIVMRIKCPELNLTSQFRDIAKLQKQDATLSAIIETAPPLGKEGMSNYAMQDNILYKLHGRDQPIWKTYIPNNIADDIILSYHVGLGHTGAEKVTLTIQEHLYIKHLGHRARKLISKCVLCQKAKPLNVKYDIEPQATFREKPRELVAVDIHGEMPTAKFGYKYIFVVSDAYSKFVKIYPLKAISTKGCLKKVLDDYIPKYGNIQSILSDNASLFASKVWRDAFECRGIKVYHSSAYFPQGNYTERNFKDITTYLRIFCHQNHHSWLDYCPIIENILNRTPNPSSRFAPEALFTGRDPPPLFSGVPTGIRVPDTQELDKCKLAFERLVDRAKKRKERTKRYKHKWNPQVGDKVLVKDRNLSSRLRGRYFRMELLFKGPFTITKVLGSHSYELINEKSKKLVGRFHKQMIRPFRE